MSDETTPISGRWTLVANPRTGEPFDLIRADWQAEAMRDGDWELIEVVPVAEVERLRIALRRIEAYYTDGWPDSLDDQEAIWDIAQEALRSRTRS